MAPLSPAEVLRQVSEALPEDCRKNVIIIGSLAAGYNFFAGDGQRTIRTKDVDCMFSPHAKAVAAAETVAERLFRENWTQRTGEEWSQPGGPDTSDKDLPLVRLKPPDERGGADWFLELLGAPDTSDSNAPDKVYRRLITSAGHYAICSFGFLALAEWDPLPTRYDVRIARPEMMALANLLHHPRIGPEMIKGTEWHRSNKDLGRVLALAWLAVEQDRRNGTENFENWAPNMGAALREKFRDRAKELALRAGAGLRELMASDADRNEALWICNKGLLASLEVGMEAFDATARRVMQTVVEPLEDEAASW